MSTKIGLHVNVKKTKIIGLSSFEGKTMLMLTNPSQVFGEWINTLEQFKTEKIKMIKKVEFNLDWNMFLDLQSCLHHNHNKKK